MDESGFIDSTANPQALTDYMAQYANATTSAVPASQPNFDQAGSFDPTKILTGAAAAITSVAGAAATLSGIPATVSFNRSVALSNDALARQQLDLRGQLSTLAAKTQLAQATTAYNKAAGIVSSPSLVVILTVAGVLIGALALWKKRG